MKKTKLTDLENLDMKKLSPTGKGDFKRDLGSPVKRFYLGKDEVQARLRVVKLERLWKAVKRFSGEWDDMTFNLGKCLARGERWTYVLPPGDEDPQQWIADLRLKYGEIIGLHLPGEGPQEILQRSLGEVLAEIFELTQILKRDQGRLITLLDELQKLRRGHTK